MKLVLPLLAALLVGWLAPAAAQPFPQRQPIRLLIPYAPGGTTDAMARVMQEPLRRFLGQSVVIENKAGAGGVPAAREVIRAAPDGYTLLFVNNGNLAVVPLISKEAHYDGLKDFTPVAMVSSAALVAVVPEALPVQDLRGFIDYARKTPMMYATAGVGSFGHLASELFASRAGVKMTHVPYKGQAPTTNAVLAGEVQLLITTPSGAMNELIERKRLKLLAVTSPEPSPLAPGTPTVGSVLPGYEAESWFAIVGPAGLPADVVARLHEAVGKVLQLPEIQQRFASFGVTPRSVSPKELRDLTAAEIARWQPVVREANIRAD